MITGLPIDPKSALAPCKGVRKDVCKYPREDIHENVGKNVRKDFCKGRRNGIRKGRASKVQAINHHI